MLAMQHSFAAQPIRRKLNHAAAEFLIGSRVKPLSIRDRDSLSIQLCVLGIENGQDYAGRELRLDGLPFTL